MDELRVVGHFWRTRHCRLNKSLKNSAGWDMFLEWERIGSQVNRMISDQEEEGYEQTEISKTTRGGLGVHPWST